MKAIIKSVEFNKEFESQHGTLYGFTITYDDKKAFYKSKSKDQKKFIKGQEAEFTEETITKDGKKYLIIKPVYNRGQSNYGKALNREQSKYSGFSDSYVKDMLVNGILQPEETEENVKNNDIVMVTWKKRAFEIFEHMVQLDKTLQS